MASPIAMKSAHRFETVAIAYGITEALCLRSSPESRGIPVIVNGLHHASINWYVTFALGGLRIQVPDADHVRDCLAAIEPHADGRQRPTHLFGSSPLLNNLWEQPTLTPVWAQRWKGASQE